MQSLGNNRFPSRNFHPIYAECKFLRIPNYAVVAFTLRIPRGLYTEANVIDMPVSVKDCLISLDTKHLALSLCKTEGKSNMFNNDFKHEIIVFELVSTQG